jgi:hypothetical protein
MTYHGDVAPGTPVIFKFTTVNTTGVATGMTSGAVSIYRDSMVTQFTTGVTLTTGFDSVVGLNHVVVATTNTTNYPVAGGVNYQAVLTGGTVAGKSVVGYVVGHFTMRNRVLGTNAILSTTINTAAITSAKFASAAITATVLNTGAITAAKFASAAITSTVLNTGAITAAKFASAAITSTVINTNAIGANELADGAITAAKFASGAITSTVIQSNAIGAAEIADGAITAAKFASAAITSTVLNTGAITAAKFGASAITATVLSTTAAAEIHTAINAGTVGTSIASILDDTGTSGVAVATGAISATSFAAGAINAAAIAADAIGASELAADAATEIADAFLNRDMSTGTDSGSTTVRTPRQALRALRNKVSISGSTLTVTKEDDATASWTAAVTTAAGNPLTSVDPEGP